MIVVIERQQFENGKRKSKGFDLSTLQFAKGSQQDRPHDPNKPVPVSFWPDKCYDMRRDQRKDVLKDRRSKVEVFCVISDYMNLRKGLGKDRAVLIPWKC